MTLADLTKRTMFGSPNPGSMVSGTSVALRIRAHLDSLILDWKKDVPNMHRYDTQDDPAPDSKPWINHILCEHQKLQPNGKLRQQLSPDVGFYLDSSINLLSPCPSIQCAAILQSIFPEWVPISIELPPCVKCAEKSDDAKVEEAKEKAQITKEKVNIA